MLNQISLMGRLVRDVELKYTPSGTAVATFTLACDRDFAGENKERATDFIDIVAWRQTGEFVSKYFTKGSMAVVLGRLQIRDWQDKDGNKRRTAEVVAANVYFGSTKKDGGASGNHASEASDRSYSGDFKGSAFSELDNGDGDLPF